MNKSIEEVLQWVSKYYKGKITERRVLCLQAFLMATFIKFYNIPVYRPPDSDA